MKKIIVAILALVYISAFTGASLHMHYCMGKLANWDLVHKKSKTCGRCGMDMSDEKANGCCKDEHKFVKNDTDQKTAETGFQMIQVLAVSLPVFISEIPANEPPSVPEVNTSSNGPPRSNGIAVHVRNCVFLI